MLGALGKGARLVRVVGRKRTRAVGQSISGMGGVGGAAKKAALGGADALQGVFTGVPARELKSFPLKHPFVSTGLAAGGAAFGYRTFKPLFENEEPSLVETLAMARRESNMARLEQLRAQQRQMRAMESLGRLAALDPQLYNELTAGRVLPQGAMMFGGTPRTDLLEAMAFDMADGVYRPSGDPDAELQQLLGEL